MKGVCENCNKTKDCAFFKESLIRIKKLENVILISTFYADDFIKYYNLACDECKKRIDNAGFTFKLD